jgi:hypothetical protein
VHAARAHADERKIVNALVALDDLVRDARERTADSIRVHHNGHADLVVRLSGDECAGMNTSSRPLGTAFKETNLLYRPIPTGTPIRTDV